MQAYVSGNAVVILGGARQLLQTIYSDRSEEAQSIAIDELSGKLAVCAGNAICIYQPHSRDEGALKVSFCP